MARNYEIRNGKQHQTKARLARNVSKKSFQVAQVHPLVCLALLFIAGAAAIPHGKPAHSQTKLNATQSFSAPQSPQPRQGSSLLSAAPAKPAPKNSRLPVVPPLPTTPTGPPNAPVLFAPANGTSAATVSPTLDVSVTDPAGSNLSVTYYGKVASTVGPDFTVVALPDTQYYSSSLNGGTPAMFNAQTQWIVNNQNSLNIAYVAHLGDIVQNGDNGGNTTEWNVADGALKILENAGIPYGVHPGNHDEGVDGSDDGDAAYTVLYNTYFGVSRFSGRSYYGGNYGTNNNNHYDLFSAGGMNFIVIYFAYDYNAAGDGLNTDFPNVLTWAQGVLKQYSDRHAILVSHYMMGNGNPANLSIQGGAIVNGLDGIPNVFLTLAGHYSTVPGEGQRTSVVSGNTVQGLMSDYQNQPNGGNGWLRIMTFSPASNQISVQTYSPVLNGNMTDAASQFTLPWNMQNSGYTNLGTVSNVPSGGQASMTWNNLTPGVQYQWYAVVSNGTYTTTGPTWSFTTSNSASPAVNLTSTNLAFGSQLENTSSGQQNVTLTNTGSATLNISNITASKDYSQTNTCGSQVLSSGNCTISVTFQPTITGTDNGTVTISDNASGGSQTIPLTGSGVAAAPVASLSTTSMNFGNQQVNTSSSSQPVKLTNTGNASLSIQSIVTSGDYAATSCPSFLGINASCTMNVTFTPTATGTRSGSINVTDNAGGSPQVVSLTGVGTAPNAPAVTLSTTNLSFGNQLVNTTSASQTVTLTNTGTATLSISSMVTSGDFAASSCPSALAPNTPCTISVTFTPTATGTRTGSITITDNASGSPQVVTLTGTSTSSMTAPAVSLSPTSLSFGNQRVGTTSRAKTVTVKNTGNSALSVPSIATSGDFSQTNTCTTVNPNKTCVIKVKFDPTATGSRTGTVTMTDNASNSPQSVPLTGAGR
jgi:hypothetical protein